MMFNGLPVTVSSAALEFTNVRNFPESKNRSRRVLKKLMKRFGTEFRTQPCIWQTPQGIVCHPVMFRKLQAAIAAQH